MAEFTNVVDPSGVLPASPYAHMTTESHNPQELFEFIPGLRGLAAQLVGIDLTASARTSPWPVDPAAEEIDAAQRLMGAVGQLAEPQRSVVSMRYLRGLTSAEIGHALSMPPATVRWHRRAALAGCADDSSRRRERVPKAGSPAWFRSCGSGTRRCRRPAGSAGGVATRRLAVAAAAALPLMLLALWWGGGSCGVPRCRSRAPWQARAIRIRRTPRGTIRWGALPRARPRPAGAAPRAISALSEPATAAETEGEAMTLRVSGRVIGTGGEHIAGATVQFGDDEANRATSDASGFFVLSVPSSSIATAPGGSLLSTGPTITIRAAAS